MEKLGPLVRVRTVRALDKFSVAVEFEDGTRRELNLKPYLRGPIFEPILTDPNMFRRMKVEGGTVAWENGADIDPDVLYYDDLKPSWMEETEPVE